MRASLLVVAVLSFGFAPIPFPQTDPKADLGKMRGTWSVTTYAAGGRAIPTKNLRVVIDEERMTFRKVGSKNKDWLQWSIRVDARQKPRNFDLQAGDPPARGIYRLDGKTLSICISFPGGRRPTGYEKHRAGQWLLVLELLSRRTDDW